MTHYTWLYYALFYRKTRETSVYSGADVSTDVLSHYKLSSRIIDSYVFPLDAYKFAEHFVSADNVRYLVRSFFFPCFFLPFIIIIIIVVVVVIIIVIIVVVIIYISYYYYYFFLLFFFISAMKNHRGNL